MVSSSGIRALLKSGRVSLAARMLEHPYALDGAVVEGRGVGVLRMQPQDLTVDGVFAEVGKFAIELVASGNHCYIGVDFEVAFQIVAEILVPLR